MRRVSNRSRGSNRSGGRIGQGVESVSESVSVTGMMHFWGSNRSGGRTGQLLLKLGRGRCYGRDSEVLRCSTARAYRVWCTVYGEPCMVYGVWCTVYGAPCMVNGVL